MFAQCGGIIYRSSELADVLYEICLLVELVKVLLKHVQNGEAHFEDNHYSIHHYIIPNL